MGLFFSRILRASMLDWKLYKEVEHDNRAIAHAVAVVIISSLAAGIGSRDPGDLLSLLSVTIGALIGWVFWALLTLFLGARIFPEPQTQTNFAQLLRTIGFSSAPGIVRLAGVIEPLRNTIFFMAAIWMLSAMVIAVRQALDFTSTLRSLLVVLGGWIIQALLLGVVLFAVQSYT